MTWRNRKGSDAEQRFEELEKEFSFENIKDIPIETAFPAAGPESASLHFVKSGGTYYIVLLAEGVRVRVALSSF